MLRIALIIGGLSAGAPPPPATPAPANGPATGPVTEPELVDASTRIRDLVVNLRYATPDNLFKRAVYPPTARCLLLPETVERLARVAAALRREGLRLRVYDCYRPHSVQWQMWKVFPKPGYVADPRQGSPHNRGAAVDLTLAKLNGEEVEMPTPFDTLTPDARHGYGGASPTAIENREHLLRAMHAAGFRENRMEWWHYQLPDSGRFPVRDTPFSRRTPARPRKTPAARA